MAAQLRVIGALGSIAALAMMLAGCSSVPGATSAPTITATAPSASPSTEAPTPSASPVKAPSGSAPPIADGTYATAPLEVAAINARIKADKELTAAEKADIIKAYEVGAHKTYTVTLDFHDGQYTQSQAFDGAAGEVGSRATYAFPDDHTLVIEEACCGITTFEVTPDQDGFSLKRTSQPPDDVDSLIGRILFESSPFTPVP